MKKQFKKGIALLLTIAVMIGMMPVSFAEAGDLGCTYDDVTLNLVDKNGETVAIEGATIEYGGGVVGADFLLDDTQTTDENGKAVYDRHYRMAVSYKITFKDNNYDFDFDKININGVLGESTQIHTPGATETSLLVGVTPLTHQELPIINNFSFYKDGENWVLTFRVGNPEKSGKPAMLRAVDDAPEAFGTSYIRINLAEKPYQNHTVTVNDGTAKINDNIVTEAKKGEKVTIIAEEIEGKEFVKWEIKSGNVVLENENSKETSFEMIDENVEVTATYKDVSSGGDPNPDPQEDYNIYMAGDDAYQVYINGKLEYVPADADADNWSHINKQKYEAGFDDETFIAVKGIDLANNIAGFKMIYEIGENKFKGTNNEWSYLVISRKQLDAEGSYNLGLTGKYGKNWYEKDYVSTVEWKKAVPQKPQWGADVEFDKIYKGFDWIWAEDNDTGSTDEDATPIEANYIVLFRQGDVTVETPDPDPQPEEYPVVINKHWIKVDPFTEDEVNNDTITIPAEKDYAEKEYIEFFMNQLKENEAKNELGVKVGNADESRYELTSDMITDENPAVWTIDNQLKYKEGDEVLVKEYLVNKYSGDEGFEQPKTTFLSEGKFENGKYIINAYNEIISQAVKIEKVFEGWETSEIPSTIKVQFTAVGKTLNDPEEKDRFSIVKEIKVDTENKKAEATFMLPSEIPTFVGDVKYRVEEIDFSDNTKVTYEINEDPIDKVEFTISTSDTMVQTVKIINTKKSDDNGGNGDDPGTGGGDDPGTGGDDPYYPYPDPDEPETPDTPDTPSGGVIGGDDEVIDDEETPLGKLNKEDQIAYIFGYPDGSVKPNGHLSREEAATVFYRLLDANYRNKVRTESNSFSDVFESKWSNTSISTLSKAGILKGYPDGTFKPLRPIKRCELAVIAAKFEGLEPNPDHNISDIKGTYAEKYIASAAKRGWVEVGSDGKFRPNDYITRSEFVTFVNNVLGWHVNKENILPGVQVFTDLTDENAPYYTAMRIATNTYEYEKLEDTYQKWTKLLVPVMQK